MGAEPEPPLAEIVKKRQGTRFESARRGYAPAQVDVFLVSIASTIDALEAELQELQSAPEVPPQGREIAEDSTSSVEDAPLGSKRVARLVEVGEREVEQMREEAKAEAATIVSDATSEADRLKRDAHGKAKRLVEEAQTFLDQVEKDSRTAVSGADERRREMVEEIRTMQSRLLSVTRALELVLNPEGS